MKQKGIENQRNIDWRR